MSLVSGIPQFTKQQLETYRYFYEVIPYTAYDPDLVPGSETIFSVQNVQDAAPGKLAVVNHYAVAPSNASLTLEVEGAGSSNIENQTSQAFPAGLVPILTSAGDGRRATSKLALKWVNASGAVIPTVQTNYAGALKDLTTADKVLRGLPLNAQDQKYQKKFQIYQQGLRPITIEEMKDRIWRRSIVDEFVTTGSVSATSTATAIPQFTVPAGTVAVLHSLAASIPSADVGNQVTLAIDRDAQENHVEILADNAPGLANPFPLWVTATNSFTLRYSAQTTTTVTYRLAWYQVKVTGLLSVILGQSNPTELTGEELTLYEKIRAGVVA